MVLTPSTMTGLGTRAPDFSLPGGDGRNYSLRDVAGEKAVLVMFICNHCPYVKHVAGELARLGREYRGKGVGVVAINSNDARSHPVDAPEKMIEEARARGYTFPYLYDETQDIARAYRAACTPDFFLFDGDGKLAYRGQLDGSRPGNGVPVTGADLRTAIDAVLLGRPVSADQRPSIGCNIKWKPGNEPDSA